MNARPGPAENTRHSTEALRSEQDRRKEIRVRQDLSQRMQPDDLAGGYPLPQPSRSQLPVESQSLEQLMWNLLEDGRRREQALLQLCNRTLTEQQTVASATSQPSTNYQIMPDITKNIEDFNGEVGTGKAKEWLQSLDSMKILHQWPDSFVLEEARTHLKDGARDWLLLRAAELRTWDTFKQAFSRSFIVADSTPQKWRKMTDRTQGPHESLTTYFYNKIRLCREINLNMKDIKEQVLVGLWSRDLCNAMAARKHEDVDQLLHDILEYDMMNVQRMERIRAQREVKGENQKKTGSKTQADNKGWSGRPSSTSASTVKNPDKRAPVRNSEGQLKCYNCNMYGHISKDCPEPPKLLKCFKCGESGHTQRHCNNTKTPVKHEVNQLVVEEPDITVRKYLKETNINEHTLIALIDPGAAECIIRASLIVKLGLDIIRENIALKSFGPQHFITESPGYVIADISIDGVKVPNVRLVVVNDDNQAVDVLVGRSFTDSRLVDYHKIDNNFSFAYSEFARLNKLAECVETGEVQQLKVLDRVVLPGRTVNFIGVRGRETEYVVPVLNVNSNSCQLDKGEVVATANLSPLQNLHNDTPDWEPITIEDINVGEHASQEVVDDLVSILNVYRRGVAKTLRELGCTDLIKMDIREISNCKPIVRRPFATSDAERNITKKILKEYREAGFVTDTVSPYASPAFLIKKKSGEPRLVVDYRALNKQTERIHFPLPNIDDQLSRLGDSKMFITLDLAMGYLQVPLTKEARAKTAFITSDDTGEFTRMVFGLMNAPFYFSKLMAKVLNPLKDENVLFYLDDIMIPGKDWSTLRERFMAVMEALVDAGLTINLKKCQFLMSKVTYLGFEISDLGIQPGKNKLRAIIDFPVPTNVTTVRQFLGLVGFFRRFVCKFSEIVAPLYDLLKDRQEFKWTPREDKAFRSMIDILAKEPILQPFQSEMYTELHTDASALGLAGMLLQRGADNRMHLVYAISRRTSEPEQNYHSSKLELLAVIWAITRFRIWLINLHFTVVTDCNALIYLNTQKSKNPQIVRWSNLLSEYTFDIVHRPGVKLAHVDALSRAPVEICESEEVLEAMSGIFSLVTPEQEVLVFQYADEKLKRKREILLKPEKQRSKMEKAEVKDYVLSNSILYKREEGKLLYVIPRMMRKALTIRFHDLQSHTGTDRTVSKLREFYFFPGMHRYVRQHVKRCLHCIITKSKTGPQAGQLHPIPPGFRPFDKVHVDHVGPFVTTSTRNTYILVITDTLSKFVILKPTKDTKAINVTRALEEVILDFGAPSRIISDRGTCFTSKHFMEFCQHHGIKHTVTSPRHPQANGLVERTNYTLIPAIQANLVQSKGRDWDKHIKRVQRDLNESPNKATGISPFQVVYGYINRHDEGQMRLLTHESTNQYCDPNQLHNHARTKILKEQERYKTKYDTHRNFNTTFTIGDIVFMRDAPELTHESTKLQKKFRGPLVITKVLPSDTYGVADLRSDSRGCRYASTAHASQLKVWRGDSGDVSSDESDSENDDYSDWEKRGAVECQNVSEHGDGKLNGNDTFSDVNEKQRASEKKQSVKPTRLVRRPKRLDDFVMYDNPVE